MAAAFSSSGAQGFVRGASPDTLLLDDLEAILRRIGPSSNRKLVLEPKDPRKEAAGQPPPPLA